MYYSNWRLSHITKDHLTPWLLLYFTLLNQITWFLNWHLRVTISISKSFADITGFSAQLRTLHEQLLRTSAKQLRNTTDKFAVYVLKFPQRQNSIESSRAGSRVTWIVTSSIAVTNSISINLMMEMELGGETARFWKYTTVNTNLRDKVSFKGCVLSDPMRGCRWCNGTDSKQFWQHSFCVV